MSNGIIRSKQSTAVPGSSDTTAEATSETVFSDWFNDIADFDMPKRGDLREGTVVSAGVGDIRIDIGGKSEGVIESRELDRMSRERRSQFQVGEQLQVYVVNPEDRDGNVVLSLERAEQERDWLWAQELLDSQEVMDGKVVGFNKGGLLVQMKSLRGFVPGSQIDRSRRDSGRGSSQRKSGRTWWGRRWKPRWLRSIANAIGLSCRSERRCEKFANGKRTACWKS